MTETEREKLMLDDLFQAAASDPNAAASPDLLARVMADAELLQPVRKDLAASQPEPSQGLFEQMLQAFGGWRPMAGVATAAVTGLWIGFSASSTLLPQNLSSFVDGDTDYYLTYFDESFGDVAEDG